MTLPGSDGRESLHKNAPEDPVMALIIRMAVVVALYLGAVQVLDCFFGMISYGAYLRGGLDMDDSPEWHEALSKIHEAPYLFLGLNLYNIAIWTAVIVFGIWLLRRRGFARRWLCLLMGFDMVVTVIHVVWDALVTDKTIASPGWFIFFNILQVAAIIALSHPRVIQEIDRYD
jgi:hypothetical protein